MMFGGRPASKQTGAFYMFGYLLFEVPGALRMGTATSAQLFLTEFGVDTVPLLHLGAIDWSQKCRAHAFLKSAVRFLLQPLECLSAWFQTEPPTTTSVRVSHTSFANQLASNPVPNYQLSSQHLSRFEATLGNLNNRTIAPGAEI